MIIFLLLACISVQQNFGQEYTKIVARQYPSNVFSLVNDEYEDLKDKYPFVLYRSYTLSEPGVTCMPLLEKGNSGLSYDRVIEFGAFPEKRMRLSSAAPMPNNNCIQPILLPALAKRLPSPAKPM